MEENYTIIRNLPNPLIALDCGMNALEVSRPALMLFNLGYDPDDNTRNRRCMKDWLTKRPALREALAAAMERADQTAAGEKLQWQDGDRFFHFTLTPSKLSSDAGGVYFIGVEDYTEQLTAEHGNARARSYLESIMSSLYLGIIVADCDLQVTNMNSTQELFLQQTGNPIRLLQAVGMHLDELLPDEGELLDKIRGEVLTEGLVYGGIMENATAGDGSEKLFSVSFFPLRGERDAIVGIIRVCEDVTEKARMESELRAAEAQTLEIATIRKVIITLNHEINNALMGVVGNAEVLLRMAPPPAPDQQAMLRAILEQAEKITAVTQQLENMQTVKTDAYLQNGPEMIATK